MINIIVNVPSQMEGFIYNEDDHRFSKAVIKGLIGGVADVAQMVLHPLDNVVYPITDVLYDATIIGFHHHLASSE